MNALIILLAFPAADLVAHWQGDGGLCTAIAVADPLHSWIFGIFRLTARLLP